VRRLIWILPLLWGCAQDPSTAEVAETSGVEREIHGFTLSETQDGRRTWDLHADYAYRIPSEEGIHLEEITLEFYDREEALNSTLTALRGMIDEKTGIMTARDRVRLLSVAGDTLTTEEMDYDRDLDKVSGPGFVRLSKPDRILTGFEFEAKPDLTDYEIRRDVNITIIDKSSDAAPNGP
jgi:LPS export ABC transporter protein LptC